MNIFVLCTGRCGSKTFASASRHISNYSSAHESRTGNLGKDRFAYPPDHIEVDNRLSWLLGRLDEAYGDSAFYVHLTRNVAVTASSFVKRYDTGIMKAYRGAGIMMRLPETTDPLRVAMDYCDTVNANIRHFLKDKSRKMDFHMETAERDFATFCQRVGAQVDMEAALSELRVRHNASR